MKQPLYLVAGLGKTGLSIARYLKRQHKDFLAFDTRKDAPGVSEFRNEFPGHAIYLEHLPADILDTLTDIISSPGLPLDLPLFVEARARDIPVYGDIECFAQEVQAPVVAITGTNGKSTVTMLVGEMAKADGRQVGVAGNIGTPVLDMLVDANNIDLWVLELSSFQLDLTHSLRPAVATILNITEDHLDRHHSMQAYIEAKQRIYRNAEVTLSNRDDAATSPYLTDTSNVKRLSFGMDKPNGKDWGLLREEGAVFLVQGQNKIIKTDDMILKGVHNWMNALAACALADSVGVSEDAMATVLKTFAGLPHRCQWVRTLNGVDWINDSKGTNIGATISAINGIGAAMQGKIVLIAGGQGKGADFSELAQPVSDFVRSAVLIGEDADKIEASLRGVVPVTRAATLEDAVKVAQNSAQVGDVVLLSPACASLDMFKDFNHRGDVFTASVSGL